MKKLSAIRKHRLEDIYDAPEILKGRRQIMAFLKIRCWRTVIRWKKLYSLPILTLPSGRPMAFKDELVYYLLGVGMALEKEKKERK